MKRNELIKILNRKGFIFSRSGGNHDIYTDGKKKIAVPRHKEIKELTVKCIFKEIGD